MNEEGQAQGLSITPLQGIFIGAGVLAAGAVLTGAVHYTSTAKKLTEEGISAAARHKAVPLAARALGVSTLFCAGLGSVALISWKLLGLESRDVATVTTFTDAVAIAKHQRVSI